MRQYIPLDPASDAGKQQLLALLTGQSNPDIRKKLQKLEHPADKDLEALMNEAWKVYNNREREEKKREDKKLAKAVVIAVAAQSSKFPGTNERGRGCGCPPWERGGFSPQQPRTGSNRCFYCSQRGHWIRDCPRLSERFGSAAIAHQGSD